jgi:GTPase SAR1 family protein
MRQPNWTQLHVLQNAEEAARVASVLELEQAHGTPIELDKIFCVPSFADSDSLACLKNLKALSLIGFDLRRFRSRDFLRSLFCDSVCLKNSTGFAEFCDYMPLEWSPRTTALDISGINLRARPLRLKRLFIRLPNLKALRAQACEVDDACIGYMLDGWPNLKVIDVQTNHIGDRGALAIACRSRGLSKVYAANNFIGEAGFMEMVETYERGGFENLLELDLTGNRIRSIEQHVLLSLDARRIFEAVLHGRSLPHARVMMVGMGGVGKSWLLRKGFLDDPPKSTEKRYVTPDIDFFRAEKCRIDLGPFMQADPSNLKTIIWDFGGQAVKHGVHEGFFNDADQRTVYLLVVSARRSPGNGTGETDENTGNRIVYWLKTLAHFVGPKPPVVIAITQCDDHQLEQDGLTQGWQKPGLRPIDEPIVWNPATRPMPLSETPVEVLRDLFGVNVVAIVDGCCATNPLVDGANDDERIEELRKAVARAIEEHTLVFNAKVPPEYPKFAADVEAYLSQRTWSTLDDFRMWCQRPEIGVPDPDDQDFMLPLLNAHGHLFSFFSLSAGRVVDLRSLPPGQRHRMQLRHDYRYTDQDLHLGNTVLHPGWLKDCVYRIVDRSPDRNKRGWFSRNGDLEPLINHSTEKLNLRPQHPRDAQLILEFLECTELCWRGDPGLGYLFPRGLESARLDDLRTWDSWPAASLQWSFLPEANFFRLIVALHKTVINGQSCVVQFKNRYLHGRNWVRVGDPTGSGAETVVMAFPDEGRVEIRFDPSHPGTDQGRNAIIQLVHHELQKLQGVPANSLPGDPLQSAARVPTSTVAEPTWRFLVNPKPKVRDPSVSQLMLFYRVGLCIRTRDPKPNSQAEIAAVIGKKGHQISRCMTAIRESLTQKYGISHLDEFLAGEAPGAAKCRLTELGDELMAWIEWRYPKEVERLKKPG